MINNSVCYLCQEDTVFTSVGLSVNKIKQNVVDLSMNDYEFLGRVLYALGQAAILQILGDLHSDLDPEIFLLCLFTICEIALLGSTLYAYANDFSDEPESVLCASLTLQTETYSLARYELYECFLVQLDDGYSIEVQTRAGHSIAFNFFSI